MPQTLTTTGIDTIIIRYPTLLRPEDLSEAMNNRGCRWAWRSERGRKTSYITADRGWTATVQRHPRGYGYFVVVRLDTGGRRRGYTPPMNPAEIITRLRDACGTMGVLGGADQWRDGDIVRVDYTWDQVLPDSPDPGKIPGYKTRITYPGGNALYLSGKRRPAPRAVTIYQKSRQISMDSGSMWRTEYRWCTPEACRRIGIVGVEDALSGLILFAALAAGTDRAHVPAAMGRIMKDMIRECRDVRDVRRMAARIRAQASSPARGRIERKNPVCGVYERSGKSDWLFRGCDGRIGKGGINIVSGSISRFLLILEVRAPP